MNLPIPSKDQYQSAKPFPHIVLDNIFGDQELLAVLTAWPYKHDTDTNDAYERLKSSTVLESGMGKPIADFIKINFQSQGFILFLEKLTGISGLVFDVHHFGLHETYPGGSLMPHLDYNQSRISGLQLRINVILFLNDDWDLKYNGALMLYAGKPPAVSVGIAPMFNRLVIFQNDNTTWHGHPEPLKCPAGRSRKSIALNYFTIPENNLVAQKTVFSNNKRAWWNDLVPPIVFTIYNRIK